MNDGKKSVVIATIVLSLAIYKGFFIAAINKSGCLIQEHQSIGSTKIRRNIKHFYHSYRQKYFISQQVFRTMRTR